MAASPKLESAQFEPNPYCTLVRSGLSGPGVIGVGDTKTEAKYQLLKLEELLGG